MTGSTHVLPSLRGLSLSLSCLAFSSCLHRTIHLSFVLFENESPRYERLNSRRLIKVIKARWRETKRWLFSQSLSNKRSTRARRNWGSRGYRDDRFHWSSLLLGADRNFAVDNLGNVSEWRLWNDISSSMEHMLCICGIRCRHERRCHVAIIFSVFVIPEITLLSQVYSAFHVQFIV